MCSIMGMKGMGISLDEFKAALEKTITRGPDMTRISSFGCDVTLGFQRLSIMGLSESGMQPFTYKGNAVVCNGEIYGFRTIKEDLQKRGVTFVSESDCDVLLPMYETYGTDMFAMLDAEYACIIYDAAKDQLIAARDPIGIRPLFYGYMKMAPLSLQVERKT